MISKHAELSEHKKTILKLQANLVKIKTGKDFFFNVAQYVSLGLIKKHGMENGKTKWILTQKANAILNVMV